MTTKNKKGDQSMGPFRKLLEELGAKDLSPGEMLRALRNRDGFTLKVLP